MLKPGILFVVKYNLSPKQTSLLSLMLDEAVTIKILMEKLGEQRETIMTKLTALKYKGIIEITSKTDTKECLYGITTEVKNAMKPKA